MNYTIMRYITLWNVNLIKVYEFKTLNSLRVNKHLGKVADFSL